MVTTFLTIQAKQKYSEDVAREQADGRPKRAISLWAEFSQIQTKAVYGTAFENQQFPKTFADGSRIWYCRNVYMLLTRLAAQPSGPL